MPMTYRINKPISIKDLEEKGFKVHKTESKALDSYYVTSDNTESCVAIGCTFIKGKFSELFYRGFSACGGTEIMIEICNKLDRTFIPDSWYDAEYLINKLMQCKDDKEQENVREEYFKSITEHFKKIYTMKKIGEYRIGQYHDYEKTEYQKEGSVVAEVTKDDKLVAKMYKFKEGGYQMEDVTDGYLTIVYDTEEQAIAGFVRSLKKEED